jgi:hypothetical protein
MSIAYYPLPAIGVSRGPPRYAMYEPNMSEEEYYEEEPLDGEEEEEYDPEMEYAEGDLDENGTITADDVLQGGGGGFGGGFGNALAPALPEYLRNSMMPLDSWQSFEGDKETEREVKALEDQLTDIELQSEIDLKKEKESKFKLSKWHIMMIAGIATTLIAILFLIMKRIK